jgi:hypothetical protein
MNFAATVHPQRRAKVASGRLPPLHAAGDNYSSVLVSFMKIEEQLKIQSVAMEHARNCAANQDWPGVQIGLAVLCCVAQDIRKIAAKANEKIGPEIDDCMNVYGENR